LRKKCRRRCTFTIDRGTQMLMREQRRTRFMPAHRTRQRRSRIATN